MELVDGLEPVHIDCWFPTYFIIAFPFDKVLELSSEHPRVLDPFDFIFFFSLKNDWWWWFVLL